MYMIMKGMYAGKDANDVLKRFGATPDHSNLEKGVEILEALAKDATDEEIEIKQAELTALFKEKKVTSQPVVEGGKPDVTEDFLREKSQDLFDAYIVAGFHNASAKEVEGAKPIKTSDTKLFKNAVAAYQKATNQTSSIFVSDEALETTVSKVIRDELEEYTFVWNDIKEMINLPSAIMSLPYLTAGGDEAEWMEATKDEKATSKEVTAQIDNIDVKTYRLRAKAFLTWTTEEDTIVAMLPRLKRILLRQMRNSLNKTLMSGDGSNKPTGILERCKDLKHTAAGATLTALDILMAESKLHDNVDDPQDLIFYVSRTGFYQLLADKAFDDVSQVGQMFNKGNGNREFMTRYGVKVKMIKDQFFGWKAAAPASGETLGILWNPALFSKLQQRGLTLKQWEDVGAERTGLFASMRVNIEQLEYRDQKPGILVVKK